MQEWGMRQTISMPERHTTFLNTGAFNDGVFRASISGQTIRSINPATGALDDEHRHGAVSGETAVCRPGLD